MVALVDVKTKKIANHWAILNICLYLLSLVIAAEVYTFSINHVLTAFAFMAVGFVLFMLNIMGAGDSKYLFSLFLLIPPVWVDQAFISLMICTMVIGGFSLFTSLVQNMEKIVVHARLGSAQGVRECLGGKFPFAPVIFFSWLVLGFKIYFV